MLTQYLKISLTKHFYENTSTKQISSFICVSLNSIELLILKMALENITYTEKDFYKKETQYNQKKEIFSIYEKGTLLTRLQKEKKKSKPKYFNKLNMFN